MLNELWLKRHSSNIAHLLHTAVGPALHPLDRALPVEGGVTLTVNGEVLVSAVHDHNHMEVQLNACTNTCKTLLL